MSEVLKPDQLRDLLACSREKVVRKLTKLDDYASYYGHVEYCRNCSTKNVAYIKKGVPASGQHIECDKCGCDVALRPK